MPVNLFVSLTRLSNPGENIAKDYHLLWQRWYILNDTKEHTLNRQGYTEKKTEAAHTRV